MTGLRKFLRTQHYFTTAYCPWANGTVERACKEVLRATRALLSEFRLRTAQWPEVYKLVQSILNHTPSPQRGNLAPITVFTGQKADSPLRSVISSFSGTTLSSTDIRARQLLNIEQLRDSIEGLHKAARDASATRRAKSRDHQHHRSGVKSPNFDIGDYVLIAKREFHAGEKLTLRWRGPRRIISALSDHVYDVQDLENGRIATVHSSRIRSSLPIYCNIS
jgi:hypothetical protein